MTEMYRIVHDVDKADKLKLFSPSKSTRTRDYPMKLNPDLLIKL